MNTRRSFIGKLLGAAASLLGIGATVKAVPKKSGGWPVPKEYWPEVDRMVLEGFAARISHALITPNDIRQMFGKEGFKA